MSRDKKFQDEAAALGYDFDGEIKIGGNDVPLVRDGNRIHISGKIPQVDNEVIVTGAVGPDVSLARAQLAAKICSMNAMSAMAVCAISVTQCR